MTAPRLLILTALVCLGFRDPACVRGQVVPVGGIARNFTLTNHKTGQPLRLYDYSGCIIVLDFFAYWCGPCQASSPDVEKNIAQYYAARGGNPYGVPIVVIAVNIEFESPADTDEFVANAGVGLAADDFRSEAWNQFNTENAIPLFVIINGAANASNRKPWEVLYEDAGYAGAATFRQIIDRVQVVGETPPIILSHPSSLNVVVGSNNPGDHRL